MEYIDKSSRDFSRHYILRMPPNFQNSSDLEILIPSLCYNKPEFFRELRKYIDIENSIKLKINFKMLYKLKEKDVKGDDVVKDTIYTNSARIIKLNKGMLDNTNGLENYINYKLSNDVDLLKIECMEQHFRNVYQLMLIYQNMIYSME